MGLPMGGRGELGSEQPSATVAPFSSWRDVGSPGKEDTKLGTVKEAR